MSNKVFQRLPSLSIVAVWVIGSAAVVERAIPSLHAAWRAVAHPERESDRLVEHTVVLVCAGTLLVLAVWVLVSVAVCTSDTIRNAASAANGHDTPAVGRRGIFRPRLVRVLVAGAMGAVVVSGGSGAAETRGPDLPQSLGGLTVPDRPHGGVRTHRVTAGESLWSIASDLLPPDATHRAVAQAWPRLHGLNRDRLGTDPDVIHPDTVLRLPAWASVPTRGAAP